MLKKISGKVFKELKELKNAGGPVSSGKYEKMDARIKGLVGSRHS